MRQTHLQHFSMAWETPAVGRTRSLNLDPSAWWHVHPTPTLYIALYKRELNLQNFWMIWTLWTVSESLSVYTLFSPIITFQCIKNRLIFFYHHHHHHHHYPDKDRRQRERSNTIAPNSLQRHKDWTWAWLVYITSSMLCKWAFLKAKFFYFPVKGIKV